MVDAMSVHHRTVKHTTHSPRVREQIAAQLPAPCIECGRPVLPEHRWHVAHRTPAMLGGRTDISNCGPAHASCNLRSGGKLGAAKTNAGRKSDRGIRPW